MCSCRQRRNSVNADSHSEAWNSLTPRTALFSQFSTLLAWNDFKNIKACWSSRLGCVLGQMLFLWWIVTSPRAEMTAYRIWSLFLKCSSFWQQKVNGLKTQLSFQTRNRATINFWTPLAWISSSVSVPWEWDLRMRNSFIRKNPRGIFALFEVCMCR